jgi:4-amino-4-deoxy-L-arabinose transferase-like glycosyltransferase
MGGCEATPRLPSAEAHPRWWALTPVLVIYCGLTLLRLASADLASDEGRFGISAVNILTDWHQLAIVSQGPLGRYGDKPFLYPLTIAASICLFGKNEFAVRVVNVVALAAAAFVVLALVRLLFPDRSLPFLTFGAFLLNPWTISYARTAQPEPELVLWGCVSLYAAARFYLGGRTGWATLCGVALGLAFLSKIWLVYPFALGCSVFFVSKLLSGWNRKSVASSALAFAVFVLVAGSHLLLAWWLAPETLADWIRLYYRFSFKSRVAGEGFDPQIWYLPWWVYWGTIFRASFFALPLVLAGVYDLAKGAKLPINAVVLSLLSPCLVFSFFRVKQPSYVYPAFPALALLIAYGVRGYFGSTTRRNLVVASLVSVLAAVLFFHLGLFGVRALAVVFILYLFFAASGLVPPHLGMAVKRFVACASICGMLFAGIMVWRQSLRHRTYYREISSYMVPALRPYRPQEVVFTAPEFPAFQFYTFRSGQYWETYFFHPSLPDFLAGLESGSQAFYVVDPSGALYGGKVSEDKLAALRQYAVDVTPEIERLIRLKLGLRVFVPSQRHRVPNGPFVDPQEPRN